MADYVTFLDAGRVIFSDELDALFSRYVLCHSGTRDATALLQQPALEPLLIGSRQTSLGCTALAQDRAAVTQLLGDHVTYERPTLEDIMYYTKLGNETYTSLGNINL
jgi:ABC-2 type transport system ATP-binding protein